MSDKIRISVIDDHGIFLDGICLLLENIPQMILKIDRYSSPKLALEKVSSKTTDLIMTDLVMQEMNGLNLVDRLRKNGVNLPVLMLSGVEKPPSFEELTKYGVSGFVHKSATRETLMQAIKAVISGQTFVDDIYKHRVYASDQNEEYKYAVLADEKKSLPDLGARQMEVLMLVAKGATNKEIARELDISNNTVKTHLRQIFFALGVRKRTACVQKAQALGILQL